MGKNKDRLNQKSIPWADSILEQVINLPAAGGEDLQSTAEAQVLAVENLLKMVNRKVAENRGEGEYVWKKSSIKTFPACTITVKQTTASTSPTILQLSSSQVDLSTVDASFFVGITGTFTNTSGSTTNVKILSKAQLEANSKVYDYTYDASKQQITFQTNFIQCTWSNWSRASSKEFEFVNFVTSVEQSEYPNGGELDGYWYEKYEYGFNIVEGEVINSANSTTLKVTHGLSSQPTYLLVYCEGTLKSPSYNIQTAIRSVYATNAIFVAGTKGLYGNNIGTDASGSYTFNSNSTSSPIKFEAGQVYKWIALTRK